MSCETLTFYNQLWCPKSQSIHLALAANNIPHETVVLEESGRGHECSESEAKEPALETNGQNTSSNYRETVRNLNLISNDPETRKKQERILEHFVKHILPFFEKAVVLKSLREGFGLFLEAISFLENELVYAGGKYFGGLEPNIVDFGIFPYLDKIGKWMPELPPSECHRVQVWMKAMRQHPLVAKIMTTESDLEHLQNYSESLKAKHLK